jgi:hypothetical protein
VDKPDRDVAWIVAPKTLVPYSKENKPRALAWLPWRSLADYYFHLFLPAKQFQRVLLHNPSGRPLPNAGMCCANFVAIRYAGLEPSSFIVAFQVFLLTPGRQNPGLHASEPESLVVRRTVRTAILILGCGCHQLRRNPV